MGGLSITGYVLEPSRVGSANSPYTQTPNIYISDQVAFDAAYPSDESAPRTDYLVFVLVDGDFPDCTFCWTKNEVIDRFDYDGREQRFRSLPGKALEEVGVLGPNSNVDRIAVAAPVSTDIVSYPIRVSVGINAGTTFTVALVLNDGGFGTPPTGTVELSRSTGNLNWAAADLATYNGQAVRYQRQLFYTRSDSNGNLGLIEDTLLLNPLPATNHYPLIRIGYRSYLTPIEVPTFGSPASGTVEWKTTTGELKFNAVDLVTYAGSSVYYDGVVLDFGATVTQGVIGTVASPGVVPLPLQEQGDLFFRATSPSFPNGFVQFPQTSYVDSFSSFGKQGVVEVRRSDGQVKFSLADQSSYGIGVVHYILADLPIERGLTLRMFRTPVDLDGKATATTATLKDVAAYYSTSAAVLADPVIGSPYVTLPALPVEDQILYVEVIQGTGNFVGELPNLSVPSPPSGYGYVLNLDELQLQYARRRENLVLQSPQAFGARQLPDPLVFRPNLLLELENTPGGGTYTPLTLGLDVLFDYTAGLMTFVDTEGSLVTSGAGASFNGLTFTDLSQNFLSYPVAQGDLLIVTSGAAAGVYTVDSAGSQTLSVDVSGGTESNLTYEVRRGREILADRYFKPVPPLDPNTRVERVLNLGSVQNSPRLSVDPAYANTYRFWFDLTTFASSVTVVANDAAFSIPTFMSTYDVEIAADTGHLNFSSLALGKNVRSMRTLELGTDYQLQPPLGFIEFSARMLENEEAYVTYAVIDENDQKVVVSERGAFLVRKELTADHPSPINTLSFNPLGRAVASTPTPQAFRGGRPQVTGEQVLFDTAASTVTFLADNQVTDALPHGATVEPDENVYIDYYIYGAIGGEKTLTVQQPPMVTVPISISEGANSFTIAGDRTGVFKANYLLKVDNSEIYIIGSSSYDAGTELTTVTLAALQSFRSDLNNPSLSITSGATRTSGWFLFLPYFTTETASWDVAPRGASKIYLQGDHTRFYVAGTILLFTNGTTFQDFAEVTGSTYESTGKTAVVLTSNNPRQYNPALVTMKRSVRPILSGATASATTSKTPVLSQGYKVYRQVEGQVGQILSQPGDYSIDDSGRVTFAGALQDDEELGIMYTGTVIIDAGRRVRASYAHTVAPTATNGLRGQVLRADYTTYLPDSFYWRVETFTNFRAELAAQYEADAKASIPSGGPRLQNSSQPRLYEQGRQSVWYEEGRLANEDLVARPTLKYYNDAINYLEDALQEMDGRVIGGHDGRFLFDGLINNPDRTFWYQVTNQIDDRFKISDAPVSITFPPFVVNFLGTWLEVYKASDYSRFYPTKRNRYGLTADPTGLNTGATILDIGVTNLRAVNGVSRRLPWAIVTKKALAGATTIYVDNADGEEALLRPSFDTTAYPNMPIVIQDRDGSWLLPVGGPNTASTLDLTGKTATSLSLSGGLPVDVPVGATVYHIPNYDNTYTPSPATPYLRTYRVGFDVGVNLQDGLLTHIKPFPPYDGTFPSVPADLCIKNPGGGEVLDVFTATNVSSTSPDRIPVLDGGIEDDDNNRSFPLLSPDPNRELVYLDDESLAIASVQSITTAPFVGIGDLDVGRTTITNQGGAWPAPIPKVHDLVEIRTGLNGPSNYYQIASVNPLGTLTTSTQFPVQDSGFEFAVSVATPLATGTGTVSPVTRLTDGVANFVAAGVQVGHTVVFTTGPLTGVRRQITNVVSATQLDITAAPTTGIFGYQVENSLLTFGGVPASVLVTDLFPALYGEMAVLSTDTPPTTPWSEVESLERFLDHVMTDVLTSSTGETQAGLATLTDTSVDFTSVDISSANFVFIRSGTSAGIYSVDSVTSPTTLDISGTTFPDTGTGISYRIVETLGAGSTTLGFVSRVLSEVDQALSDVNAFLNLIITWVPVTVDAGAYAIRVVSTDLTSRLTDLGTRTGQLTNSDPTVGSIAALETALASGDLWYEKRYTWLDTRINLEKGILVKKDRAVQNRIKAQQEALNQMIKLLTVTP